MFNECLYWYKQGQTLRPVFKTKINPKNLNIKPLIEHRTEIILCNCSIVPETHKGLNPGRISPPGFNPLWVSGSPIRSGLFVLFLLGYPAGASEEERESLRVSGSTWY